MSIALIIFLAYMFIGFIGLISIFQYMTATIREMNLKYIGRTDLFDKIMMPWYILFIIATWIFWIGRRQEMCDKILDEKYIPKD